MLLYINLFIGNSRTLLEMVNLIVENCSKYLPRNPQKNAGERIYFSSSCLSGQFGRWIHRINICIYIVLILVKLIAVA